MTNEARRRSGDDPRKPTEAGLGLEEALEIVSDLVRRHVARHGEPPHTIVLAGGSALAAHAIRLRSIDVDLYLSTLDDDLVAATEDAARRLHGPDFRLDATSVDTLWGSIQVRDIAHSPVVAELDIEGARVPVRALTPETLYVLKAAAGRQRDQDDLTLIARHTTPERVLVRAREMLPWVGDRARLPDYLHRLSQSIAPAYGWPLERIDASLGLPVSIQARLDERRSAEGERYRLLLRAAMRKAPDRISRHPDRGTMTFDPPDPSPVLKAVLERRPDLVDRLHARWLPVGGRCRATKRGTSDRTGRHRRVRAQT